MCRDGSSEIVIKWIFLSVEHFHIGLNTWNVFVGM